MMIRWLYSFLIHRHPACFRERFGEQMLSVFDESIRRQGDVRLLADATVSLVRQWLLRADYRQGREVLAGGPRSFDEFHRISERRQLAARRLNLIWILSVIPLEIFIASVIHPITKTESASALYLFLPVCIFLALYPLLNRGFSGEADGFTSISNPSHQRQTRLERRLEIFQSWAESAGIIVLILFSTWTGFVLLGFLFVAGEGMFAGDVTRTWPVVYVVVIAIQTLTYFAVLKRVNEKAVSALQQELDAHQESPSI
jgi:hypothetical protein